MQARDALRRALQLLRILAPSALCAGLLAGAGAEMACTPGQPRLSIEGAEVELSPVMLGVGSVFMKIVNTGNGGDELVSARLNIPGTTTELHEMKDGRMTRVNRIVIPSATTLEMKPGGPHIMVFMLPKGLGEGSKITLALVFERSGEKMIPAELTKPRLRRGL